MASLLTSTCWPTHFLPKWLAAFFAAVVLGMISGFVLHHAGGPARVQLSLEAYEIYTDGTKELVPAHVTTGGRGATAVPESDQGATSTDPKKPLLISREPGTKQWLIFDWQGKTIPRRIDPWPKSAIPYIVEFPLHRRNPHPVKHKTAH